METIECPRGPSAERSLGEFNVVSRREVENLLESNRTRRYQFNGPQACCKKYSGNNHYLIQ